MSYQQDAPDPFNEPYQQSAFPPSTANPQTAPPYSLPQYPSYNPTLNHQQPYPSFSAYPNYSTYPSPYLSYNPTSYQRQTAATQFATNARETGALVLSSMHEAMSRFARVSSMIEDVLRHLHMLFDAVFGLGYSLGAFRQEAALWMAVKSGPVGVVAHVLRRAMNIWRMLCVFLLSPMAGRFSPVALVLRILGLVPEEGRFEESLAELWRRREEEEGADNSNM